MQNMGLLMEYEDILLKKRKDFSATYIGQNASQKDIKELFQYVFENLLEWTPEMARDYLTMDIIQKLHLMRPLRKLEYPPEINIDQDLFNVVVLPLPGQATTRSCPFTVCMISSCALFFSIINSSPVLDLIQRFLLFLPSSHKCICK